MVRTLSLTIYQGHDQGEDRNPENGDFPCHPPNILLHERLGRFSLVWYSSESLIQPCTGWVRHNGQHDSPSWRPLRWWFYSLGWLRRHASIRSSERRFLSRSHFSRRRSSASLAFLLSLRARSRSLRRSIRPGASIVVNPHAPDRRSRRSRSRVKAHRQVHKINNIAYSI